MYCTKLLPTRAQRKQGFTSKCIHVWTVFSIYRTSTSHLPQKKVSSQGTPVLYAVCLPMLPGMGLPLIRPETGSKQNLLVKVSQGLRPKGILEMRQAPGLGKVSYWHLS